MIVLITFVMAAITVDVDTVAPYLRIIRFNPPTTIVPDMGETISFLVLFISDANPEVAAMLPANDSMTTPTVTVNPTVKEDVDDTPDLTRRNTPGDASTDVVEETTPANSSVTAAGV